MKVFKFILDFGVTFILWLYFLFFFLICYWPAYVIPLLLRENMAARFQAANHYYLRIFFGLLGLLAPRLTISLPDRKRIAGIKASVIVCNHISYLDPLLIMAQVKHAATIAKEKHLRLPIFGWILKGSGFCSSDVKDLNEFLSDRSLEQMKKTIAAGGNIFIFPEGTRSRTGRLTKFKKGAFYYAKSLGAPIEMLQVRNTNLLFPPGRFLFNTHEHYTLEMKYLGRLDWSEIKGPVSARKLRDLVQDRYTETGASEADGLEPRPALNPG
ncbi:MAG: lysophospholipid acyltransferase family protein [Thermodesulfobacteriota bacterium]